MADIKEKIGFNFVMDELEKRGFQIMKKEVKREQSNGKPVFYGIV